MSRRLPPISQLRTNNVCNLPRLTIPKLEQTRDRYARSLRGLVPVAHSTDSKEFVEFTRSVDAHLKTLDKFVNGSGKKIQKDLEERDAAAAATPNEYPFSYIEPIWDDGYLEYDDPCPINVAPGFTSKPLDSTWSQAQVASKIARSCAKWLIAASNGDLMDLPPEGKGVCFSNLDSQFGFCRKPGALRDAKHIAATPEVALRWVTVLHKGRIYLVSLVNQEGRLRSERSLNKAFSSILKSAAEMPPEEFPLGALTTANRRDWFKARSAMKDLTPGNTSNLRHIEDSLIVLCLDDGSGTTNTPQAINNERLFRNLVGAGSNSVNRWFDKHQLIVSNIPGEGFGATMEHAFSDGVLWSKWLNVVYDDVVSGGTVLAEPTTHQIISSAESLEVKSGKPPPAAAAPTTTTATTTTSQQVSETADNNSSTTDDTTTSTITITTTAAPEGDEDDALLETPAEAETNMKSGKERKNTTAPIGKVQQNGVIQLTFRLPDATTAAIRSATKAHGDAIANLKQSAVTLPFGKEHCKRSFKVGPDAMCQASIHLAYARFHREMGAAYESCSTEKFFHGRTETIRSASAEMNAFVRAALDIRGAEVANSTTAQKAKMGNILRTAADAHKKLGVEAANGEGVDRHLLALKCLVKEFSDAEGLAFFSEPLYGTSGTWVLSTSNVSQKSLNWFSFGPVTQTGYGLGYCVHDDYVNIGVSSYRSCATTDAEIMAKHLSDAAKDVVAFLT